MAVVKKIMLAYHRKFAMTDEQASVLEREVEAFLRLFHDEQYQPHIGSVAATPSDGDK
jgi:hypothetical protein